MFGVTEMDSRRAGEGDVFMAVGVGIIMVTGKKEEPRRYETDDGFVAVKKRIRIICNFRPKVHQNETSRWTQPMRTSKSRRFPSMLNNCGQDHYQQSATLASNSNQE